MPSQDFIVMATGACYIASARTELKTPIPTFVFLGEVSIRADRIENTVPLLLVESLLR
jgi:hypothetical protein